MMENPHMFFTVADALGNRRAVTRVYADGGYTCPFCAAAAYRDQPHTNPVCPAGIHMDADRAWAAQLVNERRQRHAAAEAKRRALQHASFARSSTRT